MHIMDVFKRHMHSFIQFLSKKRGKFGIYITCRTCVFADKTVARIDLLSLTKDFAVYKKLRALVSN